MQYSYCNCITIVHVLKLCEVLRVCDLFTESNKTPQKEEAVSYESRTHKAISLMQAKLPEYDLNTFLAAGFDTLKVIANMDVGCEPGKSLQLIEEFIHNEDPLNPRCVCGTTAAKTFLFPPGHYRSIVKSVQQLKQQEEKRKTLCQKRDSEACCAKFKKKSNSFLLTRNAL